MPKKLGWFPVVFQQSDDLPSDLSQKTAQDSSSGSQAVTTPGKSSKMCLLTHGKVF